jgi:hypothetical protein
VCSGGLFPFANVGQHDSRSYNVRKRTTALGDRRRIIVRCIDRFRRSPYHVLQASVTFAPLRAYRVRARVSRAVRRNDCGGCPNARMNARRIRSGSRKPVCIATCSRSAPLRSRPDPARPQAAVQYRSPRRHPRLLGYLSHALALGDQGTKLVGNLRAVGQIRSSVVRASPALLIVINWARYTRSAAKLHRCAGARVHRRCRAAGFKIDNP